MPTRVAINGFGRAGRCFLRSALQREADLEVLAVDDVADARMLTHLFEHDSIFGRYRERSSPLTTRSRSTGTGSVRWPSPTRGGCRGGSSAWRWCSSPPPRLPRVTRPRMRRSYSESTSTGCMTRSRATTIRSVCVGYVNTPESEDALATAAKLAASAGASLRLLTVFDPADYAHGILGTEEEPDLRGRAQHALDRAVASVEGSFTSGELIDGDPTEVLERLSPQFDLLVLGSRSHGPLRALLLGRLSRELVHRADCPVMVVPHVPDLAHEVALVGGLESPVGA